KLHLVREASLNANMTDDGTMLLHVGTLAELNSEAELIAVLGHEYGHYAREHNYHRYNEWLDVRNQNKYLANGGLIGTGLMLLNTKRLFSDIQAQEKEADDHGVQVFK